MWHVSSRGGVATLRTAIHFSLTYLLTYLLTYTHIDAGRIVCCKRLCNGRVSVRPPVSLSRRSTAAAECGGFAAERPAGRTYRSTAAGTGAQQQRRRSTAFSSKCEQRHVYRRRRKLHTDLFHRKQKKPRKILQPKTYKTNTQNLTKPDRNKLLQ